MTPTSIYYQPTIHIDDMTTIRAALLDYIETMENAAKAADAIPCKSSAAFFRASAKEGRRAMEILKNAPTVDLDDMERHATR